MHSMTDGGPNIKRCQEHPTIIERMAKLFGTGLAVGGADLHLNLCVWTAIAGHGWFGHQSGYNRFAVHCQRAIQL